MKISKLTKEPELQKQFVCSTVLDRKWDKHHMESECIIIHLKLCRIHLQIYNNFHKWHPFLRHKWYLAPTSWRIRNLWREQSSELEFPYWFGPCTPCPRNQWLGRMMKPIEDSFWQATRYVLSHILPTFPLHSFVDEDLVGIWTTLELQLHNIVKTYPMLNWWTSAETTANKANNTTNIFMSVPVHFPSIYLKTSK